MAIPDVERIEITKPEMLWDWLGENHAQPDSILLVTWKAKHPQRYVSRDEVLDALIASGWVDGRRYKVDDDRTMQLISPRRQQAWARSYKVRAEKLEADGKMRASGRQAIEASKASGLWAASEAVDRLEEPDDLVAELKQLGGHEWWAGAAPSYRRNILRWVASAKKPDTRQRRIATVAEHAAHRKKVPNY